MRFKECIHIRTQSCAEADLAMLTCTDKVARAPYFKILFRYFKATLVEGKKSVVHLVSGTLGEDADGNTGFHPHLN